MSADRPDWVTAALEQHPAPPPTSRSLDHADLEPGDLWVFSEKIKPYAGVQRVALVMDTDVKNASVTAALTSVEIAFAGDRDLVLTAEETDAYPLMVQTGMVARLPWSHAHHRVGMVDDDLVDTIINFVWDDRPDELEPRRGHAWLEPDIHERVAFEEAELKDLRKLAKRTDPRFGGGEAPAGAALTVAAAEMVVRAGSAGFGVLELLARDQEQCLHREMTTRDGRLPEIIQSYGGVESLPEPTIGTVSDLRMLMQPEIDRLLCHADITTATCIDGTVRFVFEPGLAESNSDWFVLCSPPLVQEFGRAGLVARTEDDRDVYIVEAFD